MGHQVAFAAGRLAVATGDTVRIIDGPAGKEFTSFKVQPESSSGNNSAGTVRISDVSLTVDGRYAIVSACVNDAENPQPESGSTRNSDRYNEDGHSTCGRPLEREWNVENGQALEELFSRTAMSRRNVPQVAIADPGGHVVVAHADHNGEIEISKGGVANSSEPLRFALGEPASRLFLTADGQIILSVSASGMVTSWSLDRRRLERRLYDGFPSDLAISSSGNIAAVGDSFGAVVIGAERTPVLRIPPPKERRMGEGLHAVALDEDGQEVAVSQGGRIEVWKLQATTPLFSVDLDNGPSASVALEPAGRLLASGRIPEEPSKSAQDRASPPEPSECMLDSDDRSIPAMWRVGEDHPIVSVSNEQHIGVGVSSDGANFAITTARPYPSRCGWITLFRRSGNEFVKKGSLLVPDGSPLFVAFSPDGKKIAVSFTSGPAPGVIFYNIDQILGSGPAEESGRILGRDSGVRLAFSPNGALLAVTGEAGVQLWDVATKTRFGSKFPTYGSALVGVVFSPDGRRLVTGDAWLDEIVEFDLDESSWISRACDLAGRKVSDDEIKLYGLDPGAVRACSEGTAAH
jgi:WD40 repeat protein